MTDGDVNKIITGEKRWIASFMLDLVGSTALTEKIGPEQAFLVIEEVLRQAVETIESFGGHPVNFAGDSVFAIFGAPVAIEDATLNACRAAITLQASLASEDNPIRTQFGVAPEIRIGIAGGEVMLAALGVDEDLKLNALGSAVNIAARVQTLAPPGQIYCAQAVIDEIEGFVKTDFVGEKELKGIARPQNIYRLVEVLERESSLDARLARSAAEFVGRAGDLARLGAWLTDPAPEAMVCLVNGPAGIGKSRMVRQALDALPSDMRVAVAYCTPDDAQTSLRPVLNLIRTAAAMEGAENAEALTGWMGGMLPEGAAPNTDLVDMVSRSAVRSDRQANASNALEIRNQINALLRSLAADPARRLVIEDVHWLDPLSRALIADVVDQAAPGSRLLVTSREPMLPDLADDRVAVLPLSPLTAADIAALIDTAFAHLSASDDVKRLIFEKSEGNPLFAEELVRHLRRGDEADTGLTLPPGMTAGSIQNLVFSRFDKLDALDKAALKQAAILGRVIKTRHLEHITGSPEAAARVFKVAAENGLVDDAPDTEHRRFAHVLIQDAIQSSIPSQEAKQMHLRAAEILIETEAGNRDDLAPSLAMHFDRAGMTEQAIGYYTKSAKLAWKIYALDVCLAHLKRAEELLDASDSAIDDALYADFMTVYCRLLDITGAWEKLIDFTDKQVARLARLTDRSTHSICLTMLTKGYNEIGKFDTAMDYLERAIAIAEEVGDETALAVARIVKMDVMNDSEHGTLENTLQLFHQTQDYADSGQDPHMALLRLYEMSTCYRRLGDTRKCAELIDQMVQYGHDHNDKRAFTFGEWARSLLYTMVEDYEAVKLSTAESMRNSLPGTFDYSTAQVLNLGARFLTGDTSITNAELEKIYEDRVACGDISVAGVTAFYSASLHFIKGEIRAGWARLQAAEARIAGGVERGLRSQFAIKKAELLLTFRGVFPSPVPMPKLALAELPLAAKLRLQSVRMAEDLYNQVDREFDFPDGFHRARIEMGRGLIAKARGKRAQARAHFETALELFEQQDYHVLTNHVRGFLSS